MNQPRIGILLSHVREEEKLLLAAFARRGVELVRLMDRRLIFELTALDRPQPEPLDLVLDRCMAHGRAAVSLRVYQALGVRCVNTFEAAVTADDKIACSLALAKAGVPTIRTMVAFDVDSALEALEEIGYPAVLKPVAGSWGRLLAKVNSPIAARDVLEHKRGLGSHHHAIFYVQEYVEKPGRDLRIFVVGDQIVAASYRTAEHWVTNVARGAASLPCPITPEIAEISLAAARAIGAEIAGIDLVEAPDGLKVIEVNGGVEFKGLMKTTDIDIAGAVADYTIGQARLVRERDDSEGGNSRGIGLRGGRAAAALAQSS